MCKSYVAYCTKTNAKFTKEVYISSSYCMIRGKELACIGCFLSESLHNLG